MTPCTCRGPDDECGYCIAAIGRAEEHRIFGDEYGWSRSDLLERRDRMMEQLDEAKFWSRVRKGDACWEWVGSRTAAGYGNLRLPGNRFAYAHRVSYELAYGAIPEGLQIDHLCRVRHCVNPDHLEAVEQRENIIRAFAVRTTCKRGHDRSDPANIYTSPRGDRRCRVCAVERERARDRRAS